MYHFIFTGPALTEITLQYDTPTVGKGSLTTSGTPVAANTFEIVIYGDGITLTACSAAVTLGTPCDLAYSQTYQDINILVSGYIAASPADITETTVNPFTGEIVLICF